jgi:hypothetical protein
MGKLAVRTPGDKPNTADGEGGSPAGDVSLGETVTSNPGKKLSIEERFDLLEAENARLRENQAAPKSVKVDPTADLPDISEYTGKNQHRQNELASAVLTKQGWVAPAHLGANPAALNELQKRGMVATSVN